MWKITSVDRGLRNFEEKFILKRFIVIFEKIYGHFYDNLDLLNVFPFPAQHKIIIGTKVAQPCLVRRIIYWVVLSVIAVAYGSIVS